MVLFNLEFIISSLIKFTLTTLFTAILSVEREWHDHPSGVVTHLLAGLGSCLFTIISTHVGKDSDPSRIASQVVSGMGFLGSATVFSSGNYVKGINTAANLWISAAIGMAVGIDLWEFAFILSMLVLVILTVSNKIYKIKRERKKNKLKENKNDIESSDIENQTQNQIQSELEDIVIDEIDN